MLDDVGAFLQVILLQDGLGNPSSDLARAPFSYAIRSSDGDSETLRDSLTAFDMSIMALMLGASEPYSLGHALPRHSCGVILEKRRPSMIVSCRASSSGSMSTNLILRKLRGTIEGGRAPGARLPTARGAAPESFPSGRQPPNLVALVHLVDVPFLPPLW